MTATPITSIVNAQREYFLRGDTLPVDFRIRQLRRLKAAVLAHQNDISAALAADLGRCPEESYLCDIGPIVVEINEILAHLRRWARPERHFSGLLCFPSTCTQVYKMPYGVSLIISPYNFPFLLTFGVLAAAIAGGNTAIIKTSSKSVASTHIMRQIVSETFVPEYITLIEGGHEVANQLLENRFDKIFYTGSPTVAKHVMAMAAKNLTPVTLELGGETGNWSIVRKDADLRDAARKIAFFKSLNAGQICININAVAVAHEVAPQFVHLLQQEICRQLGSNPESNAEYPSLITDQSYAHCTTLSDQYADRIVYGGHGNQVTRKYAPTILYPIDIDDPIVQHELFNPLLPIVEFKDNEIDRLLDTIARREHPLAMYLFTRNRRWGRKVMSTMQYGGGCLNEVCIHLMVKGVPFGGTGHSGMGAYHGVWGFREFTHPQTVLEGKNHLNISIREHPFGNKPWKLRLIKRLEK